MPDAGGAVLANATIAVTGTLDDGVRRHAWPESFTAIMPHGLGLDAHHEIVMEPHFRCRRRPLVGVRGRHAIGPAQQHCNGWRL